MPTRIKSSAQLTSILSNPTPMSHAHKTFLKKHFWSNEAFISFMHTFSAIFLTDSAVQLATVAQGDFSKVALLSLGGAILRAALKALFALAKPETPKV